MHKKAPPSAPRVRKMREKDGGIEIKSECVIELGYILIYFAVLA